MGITGSWANNDITDAELGLEGYVMFRKDRMGRKGGGVLLYIKDTTVYQHMKYSYRRKRIVMRQYGTNYLQAYSSYHWSSTPLSQHNQTEQRKNT